MNKNELEQLLNEKGIPCISIVVPTHRLATERQADKENIEKAISIAKSQLEKYYTDTPFRDKMVGDLEMLAKQIDFTHSLDGLGIYVSPHFSKIIHYPFPVVEKIVIGDSFDSRDMLYAMEYIMEFYLLSISKKYVRLFKCAGLEIVEVKDDHFPMEYKEEFEYVKPSIASSFTSEVLVGYEKDKSFLQEERLKEFLRTADKNLGKYIKTGTALVVSGDNKEINDFTGTTSYEKNLVATVRGNYVVKKELINNAWIEIRNYVNSKNEVMLSDIEELVGKHLALTKVEDIWKAVLDGKGLKLVLEKDYDQPAYLTKDKSALQVNKPAKSGNYEYVTGITDMLIKQVRSRKGSVTFVDNGSMKKFNGPALTLRYS